MKENTQLTEQELEKVSGGRTWPGGLVYRRLHPNQFYDPNSVVEKFKTGNSTRLVLPAIQS